MKWSKRPKSLTEKGEFSPHVLPISGRSPKEMLGASWHWQVGINPWQVSAISRMRSPWNRRAGLLTCFTQGVSFVHAKHRRVSKVQQKTCSLGEQKLELQASLPCPEGSQTSPQDERLLLNHTKTLGFLSSREEFNPSPETRLDRSELLVIKFIKETEKASDIDIRRGWKEYHLLVLAMELYTLQWIKRMSGGCKDLTRPTPII